MMPKKRVIEYEKVIIGEFVNGVIENIERDENHKSTYQGKEKISDCIRFVFKLEKYTYLHKSNWMSFSYGSKSTLFSKYLIKLIDGAQPDFEFDIDKLKGISVKTVWSETEYQGKTFQHIESIFPVGAKIKHDAPLPTVDLDEEPPLDPNEHLSKDTPDEFKFPEEE
jgi:hypothetical protein